MNYQETIAYLYAAAPLFQQIGGAAYKEGLENTETLDAHFGHPHRKYPTIHVAGTNGKGSCAHTLAAAFQAKGWKTGLYTSPHLVDFRERIRINGEMIPEEKVVEFVEKERAFFEPLHPSFFELTTALALKYFADEQVDIAIIEVGLGGRLDCTNIIVPALSVITNISLDHTQFLGHTLAEIAREKAGIIKPGVPVVIGEALPETRPVFEEKARNAGAPICFAEDTPFIKETATDEDGLQTYITGFFGDFTGELTGECQTRNTETLLHAFRILSEIGLLPGGEELKDIVKKAFRHVCSSTGLSGRWQIVGHHPLTVCDAGHNPGGWQYLGKRLSNAPYAQVHIVFGMMGDKDVDTVLSLLPARATYYFTRASVKRSMGEKDLQAHASRHGLTGNTYPTVEEAVREARRNAGDNDLIFIGGSCFIVADFLASEQKTKA